MNKFSQKLWEEYPTWKLFLGMFVCVFLFTLGVELLILTLNIEWYLYLLLPTLFGLMLGGLFSTMVSMGRQASKFYGFADEIEQMIRCNQPLEDVKTKLKELQKEGFHAVHSDRVRELAKMAEIKYDAVLLNRHAR